MLTTAPPSHSIYLLSFSLAVLPVQSGITYAAPPRLSPTQGPRFPYRVYDCLPVRINSFQAQNSQRVS